MKCKRGRVKRTNRGFPIYAEINQVSPGASFTEQVRLQQSSLVDRVLRCWLFTAGRCQITNPTLPAPERVELGFALTPSQARRLRDGLDAFLRDARMVSE